MKICISRFMLFPAYLLGCLYCFADPFLRIQNLELDDNCGVILSVEADKDYSYTVLTSETIEGLSGEETATITNSSESTPIINAEFIAKKLFLEKEEGNLRFFKVVGTATDYTEYSGTVSEDITIKDDETIKLNGVMLSAHRVICEGDATIILEGYSSISGLSDGKAAIRAGGTETTLTIKGTGSLTATAGNYAAGIGGDQNTNCGDIVIESGTITATGGQQAPGIGSGLDKACGTITINGGKITARVGGLFNQAPYDIGPSRTGVCGTVTISESVNLNGSTYQWQPQS